MALSGIHTSVVRFNVATTEFKWQVLQQDPITNASTISVQVKLNNISTSKITIAREDESDTLGTYIKINDNKVNFSLDVGTEIPANTSLLLANTTFVIQHTSNASQEFSWGFNAAYDFEYKQLGTNQSLGNVIALGTDTVDAILRKAMLTSVPIRVTDEDSVYIEYNCPLGNAYGEILLGMSLTGNAEDVVEYRTLSSGATSYYYNFDAEEKALFYEKLADTHYDEFSINFFLYSEVPNADGTYTVATHRHSTNLNIINYKPTLNVQLKDTDLTTLAATGDDQIFIYSKSVVYFDLNSAVYKGATVVRKWIQCGNGDTYNNQETGYISDVYSPKFYAYIEDSRGFVTTQEINWQQWVNYFPLTCIVNAEPLDANGNLKVHLSGMFYHGTFGTKSNSNTLRMEYRIRPVGSSSNTWSTIGYIDYDRPSDTTFSYDFTITGLDYTKRYELVVRVIDEMMATTSSIVKILSANPLFEWDSESFNFNIPVMYNGGQVPSIVEQGTNGTWHYRKWSDGLAECWCSYVISTSITTASSAAGWYSSGELYNTNLTFPFTFTGRPIVNVSVNPTGSTWAFICPSNTAQTTSQTGTYQLNAMSSFSSKTYYISYQVRGKWK